MRTSGPRGLHSVDDGPVGTTAVLLVVAGAAPAASLHVLGGIRRGEGVAAEAVSAALHAHEGGAVPGAGRRAGLEVAHVADGGAAEDGSAIAGVATVHTEVADSDGVRRHERVDGGRADIVGRGQRLRTAGQGGGWIRSAVEAGEGADAVDDTVARNLRRIAARQLGVDVDGVVVAVTAAGLG